MATSNKIRESKTKSIHISPFKFLVYFTRKNLLFYFIHPFLQNTHISLSILHIYSIKYSFFLLFFIIFFTSLSLTVYLSLTDQPPSPSNQPPPSSTHPTKHHQLTRPYRPTYPKPHSTQKKAKSTQIPEIPFNPNESQINPIQPESH